MKLTLYMLRHDLADEFWGLRESAGEFFAVTTRTVEDLDLQLLVRQSQPKRPLWLRDLLAIVPDGRESLSMLSSQHCAAILLIRHRGYRFVLVYGTGHLCVDGSYIEQGFGLKVVANSIAGSRVVSADTRGLGRARSQRTVLPSAGPLYELGIEPSEQWVRQLEGIPTIDFANGAAGGDSLQLKLRGFSLSRLGEKLTQIIDKYESSEYKADFDFLDYFRRVHRDDKDTRAALEHILVGMIDQRSPDISFAAPDITEPLAVDHYVLTYKGFHSDELIELVPEAVYEAIEPWKARDPLHDISVVAVNSSGDVEGKIYKLLHYIVADVGYNDQRYALSAGVWFIVDSDYVHGVQRRIDVIPDLTDTLALDPWSLRVAKKEDQYNTMLASRGWRLLDRHNFPIEKANQKVEVCDLLSPTKQLICVKRMTKSGTLSHLFAQGLVSAELLVSNADGYQNRVVDELRHLDPAATFGQREDWMVVYAIATTKPGPLSQSLFFFSKVNLDRTVRHLNGFGVKTALARIPLLP